MAYFIIIRGPLGCGKTTIARRLAGILKARYISVDSVLEENGLDTIDPAAGCIPSGNFIKANKITIPDARADLGNGRVVIFDACFYHKETIEHLIKELPYPSYVFTLKAPLKVCIERDRKRKKNHGEVAAMDVYKLVSRFDYGIIIDATKPVEKSVKEILSCLKN